LVNVAQEADRLKWYKKQMRGEIAEGGFGSKTMGAVYFSADDGAMAFGFLPLGMQPQELILSSLRF